MSKFPWLRVWMLVFSIGGIWLIGASLLRTTYGDHGSSVAEWLGMAVLAVVGLTAFWKMPAPFSIEEDESPLLGALGRLYLDSWRALLRMRWLLILVGGIALIGILDGVAQRLFFDHYLAKETLKARGLLGTTSGPVHLLDYILDVLPTDLARKTCQALNGFFPHFTTHAATGGTITPLAVLALMVWLNRRLKRLAGDPRLSRTALLCRIMFIPIAVVALTVPPATYLARMAMLAYAMDPAVHKLALPVTPIFWSWGTLFGLFVTPFLLAGFAGSLKRSSEGNQVSGDTFVEDAVRYVKPFVGIFLIWWLVGTVVGLPGLKSMVTGTAKVPNWFMLYHHLSGFLLGLFSMLFMFAPYAVVAREVGTFRALRIGIGNWFSHAGIVVSFVAVGIAIIVPIQVIEAAGTALTRGISECGFAITMLYIPIGAMMSAWLAVSVWELYRRIGRPAITEVIAK